MTMVQPSKTNSHMCIQDILFNRKNKRLKALSHAISEKDLSYGCQDRFSQKSRVILANASSVGMGPNSTESPITMVLFLSFLLNKSIEQ